MGAPVPLGSLPRKTGGGGPIVTPRPEGGRFHYPRFASRGWSAGLRYSPVRGPCGLLKQVLQELKSTHLSVCGQRPKWARSLPGRVLGLAPGAPQLVQAAEPSAGGPAQLALIWGLRSTAADTLALCPEG